MLHHLFNADRLKMASTDIVDMFPSIPTDLAITCTEETFLRRNKYTELEIQEIMQLLSFCLHNNMFQFEQNTGLAMGSPLSTILSDINHFECEILNSPELKTIRYYRYVDDTLIIYREDKQIELLFAQLNNINKNIKFTRELDGVISFLDVQIYRKNKKRFKYRR